MKLIVVSITEECLRHEAMGCINEQKQCEGTVVMLVFHQ
jgi:hypothetical protein